MIITTTLKDLRKAGACVEGYNRLVCALSGRQFDDSKKTYIRFKHHEEIPLAYVVSSNGIKDALWALRASNCTDKDARLFAVWCARQIEHLMADERSKKALDVSEQFANGKATKWELSAAREAARGAAWEAARGAAWEATWGAAREAARGAAWEAARGAAWEAAWGAAWEAAWGAARGAAWEAARGAAWEAAWGAAWDAQKEMFIKMCNGKAPWQYADFEGNYHG